VAPTSGSLAPGTVLQETYEIVRPVGAGGMGEVYEARHARLPGRFAVKVLTARVTAGSPDFLRFRREAEIASSLRHPHIVQVVDFNQAADGNPYIVMEFLDGEDLAAVMARAGGLAPPRVAAIVEQVASALAAAHGRGIVHRDLKPQNVFLVPVPGQEREWAKVVDFGISKVKTALSLTGEARLVGTPQYMAPEQAQGHPDAVDGRTDEFALAVMAYEMLSGQTAFAGDSVPAVLYKVAHEALPPLAGRVSGVTAAVDAVLARALAKDKQDRYTSVLEFASALQGALGGAGAAGRGEGTAAAAALTLRASSAVALARASRARVRRILLGGLIGGALVAVGVITVASGRRRRQEAPAPVAAASPQAEPASAAAVAPQAAVVPPAPREADAASTSGETPVASPAAPVRRASKRAAAAKVAPTDPAPASAEAPAPPAPARKKGGFIVDF
jgi:eukaryotic-like serine/threonine-protein kinase